ncbi:MAG: contractile injection system tape measure protein [Gammaproteobacteria bacterium]
MNAQRHVIKRLTVEISSAKKANARQLQELISRLFQQQLPPVLDRCLSKAGDPDCLHRIDYVELDLGELDGNYLEAELLEKIDAALEQALHEQLNHSPSQPQNNSLLSHLELFEHFVRKGSLPWWADSSQRNTPEKSLAALLSSNATALKHLLARLIQDPRCLQRLISYFDDSQLVAMMALLTANKDLTASLLQTLSAVYAPLHQHSGIPVSQLRAALWQSLLQIAITANPVILHHAEFLTAVTLSWARLKNLPHKTIADCLQQLLSNNTVMDNPWLQTLRRPAPAQQSLLSTNLQERTIIETSKAKPAFSDTDSLYINNAGLCILWPYLSSFFERLELLQNNRFRNQEAKQCAVSLLHYLVFEELDPPEYLLPFNKLLCAMAIDDVFDLSTPLTAAQIAACDELLAAVIGNAPILNNMSLNGFRGSFLLRQGSISASEGCWLLRVEQETYDLVLDRFPWTWQWFKLPWMEHPLRVEW